MYLSSFITFLLLFGFFGAAQAQSTISNQPSQSRPSSAQPSTNSTSLPVSLSLSTSLETVTFTTRSGNQNSVVATVVPVVFTSTFTVTPTTSASATSTSASETASATPSAVPIVLATKVDPAFGVLGAILILTGLPSAFYGHKNRWSSFFLTGFYTLALVCAVLIIKFGILNAVNPPNKTLRGLFVLSIAVAGTAGGAVAIFFWKAARYCIGAWGGFAFALWVQCFHNGGVIIPIGFRWILYIGCGVVGFTLCTIPKIHYHVLLISTAFVGASAFILGVDCYTTAGLKEFYIWNLGFMALFPKFVENGIKFPVTQTMQIELGLIGAVALMGIAVQLRILKVLQRKLREISEATRRQDEEAELQASERLKELEQERYAWERDHPTLTKNGRQDSFLSWIPLMKDKDGSTSPTLADQRSAFLPNEERKPRPSSGLSEFKAAPPPEEEIKKPSSQYPQAMGVLPAMDLGAGIQEDVPSNFIAEDQGAKKITTVGELEDLKRTAELLAEIQTIRRSIDVLKSETPIPSSSEQSRRPSLASRRTLSVDAHTALLPLVSHARPPRAMDPRTRVHSMGMSSMSHSPEPEEPISRPTSVPLNETDWDTYIQEQELLQPPAGVTAPIATTPMKVQSRVPMPSAVQDALNKRKVRESALGIGEHSPNSSEDIPLAKVALEKRNSSAGNAPVTILPPRRQSAHIAAPTPQLPPTTRTYTFEELNERHREKMRDLQGPVTQAANEGALLEAARQRWERAKALEKEAVTRRQAEKVAALEKRKRAEDRGHELVHIESRKRQSRSLSVDKLASNGSTSRRLSTLKVEDWQRYQREAAETAHNDVSKVGGSKADRVPFPDAGRGNSQSRRKSRDHLS